MGLSLLFIQLAGVLTAFLDYLFKDACIENCLGGGDRISLQSKEQTCLLSIIKT